jgi:ABC-2 type transport system ATP-binding protein
VNAPAIQTAGLTRVFGQGPRAITALDGVSLEVGYGEVVALLGSNGAGKTTLVKILATLLLPSNGSVTVAGDDVVRNPRRARATTGVVFGGDRGLYGRLTARDNLRFFGMLAGVRRGELRTRVADVLARVNLLDAADRRVETYSRGMRQRMHLAVGLIARPKVLLLDEPTVGLDPIEANRLRESVAAMRDEGVAVLLTSHYLLDVEALADRVLLLSGGRIRENLTLADFLRQAGHTAVITVRGRGGLPDMSRVPLPDSVVAGDVRGGDGRWTAELRLREWNADVFAVLSGLFVSLQVDDVQVRETRLEEAFTAISMRLTP